jgi:hypothetical protein
MAREETQAILAYELFLRYQEMALHYAGSPYYYPAIGSTMACTGTAYAAAGGMNRRQAGEDFYFLQQLAKTGGVARIRDTVVLPSSRPSHRVPFGTGRKVGNFSGAPGEAYLTYDPETYGILRAWLDAVAGNDAGDGAALQASAEAIAAPLGAYLSTQSFVAAWDRMAAQAKTRHQRAQRFHEWFDAFRTLKCTHYLRDHGHPRVDLFAALGQVMAWQGVVPPVAMVPSLREDLDGQRALLQTLRAWRAEGPARC